MNGVLLLSGGIGMRLGHPTPKQYLRVRGRMIVTYALQTLLISPKTDAIWIVAEASWQEAIWSDVLAGNVSEDYNVDKIKGFVSPGSSRQESIWNGLQQVAQQIPVGEADTILIHDAARPCVTGELIARCYEALPGHDGVMPVLPMKDTVYLSQSGDRVEQLLERSAIYAGQAPELFRLGPYYAANEALLPDAIHRVNGSTQPAVLAGMDIAMILGDEKNCKITTAADLKAFEQFG